MYDVYTVMPGDTIGSISSKFKTSPEIIEKLNGNINNLIPGVTLIIPKRKSEYLDYYIINNGDTLYNIAKRYNIDPNLLAELNGININDYIYPNQTIIVPKRGTKLYITAEGDTLNEIVKGLDANIDKLLEQNNKIYLQKEQLIVYKYE